jgi:16S rRNA (uracil1498-N3)-methyltransferase
MKQFVLDCKPNRDGIVRLDGKDYHYLVRVRRLAVGEFFPVILSGGEESSIQILSINDNVLTGKCNIPVSDNTPVFYSCKICENSLHQSSEIIPRIILFQALPKSDKMDLIVRQAAEAGITQIVPFVSEFSTGKVNVGEKKFTRWERIIKEARQQSGSKIATALLKPLTIHELLNYWNELKDKNTLGLLFHHLQLSACTHDSLKRGLEKKSLHGYLDINPKIVVMAIGPEGGFSDKEVSLFLGNGLMPLTIGDTILRTETAALFCTAAIRIILLERDTWKLNKARTNLTKLNSV